MQFTGMQFIFIALTIVTVTYVYIKNIIQEMN